PSIYKTKLQDRRNNRNRLGRAAPTACREVMSGTARLPTEAGQGRRPHDKRRGNGSR
ncbi:unnamed protein product, partial [Dovyalis caffra]